MVIMLFAVARNEFGPLIRPWTDEAHDRAALVRMLRIGVPIALQFELEIACFGGVAFLAGAMGTVQVASHQIAINLASLTYMVPLGVSAAATVLVGRAVGARRKTRSGGTRRPRCSWEPGSWRSWRSCFSPPHISWLRSTPTTPPCCRSRPP